MTKNTQLAKLIAFMVALVMMFGSFPNGYYVTYVLAEDEGEVTVDQIDTEQAAAEEAARVAAEQAAAEEAARIAAEEEAARIAAADCPNEESLTAPQFRIIDKEMREKYNKSVIFMQF